jgi:transcription initiation factor TFIIIB Brf1 subunit/transcription initiation factor TFIIB
MKTETTVMDAKQMEKKIAELTVELSNAQKEINGLTASNRAQYESLETWKSIARKSDEERDSYKSKLDSLKVIINAL